MKFIAHGVRYSLTVFGGEHALGTAKNAASMVRQMIFDSGASSTSPLSGVVEISGYLVKIAYEASHRKI